MIHFIALDWNTSFHLSLILVSVYYSEEAVCLAEDSMKKSTSEQTHLAWLHSTANRWFVNTWTIEHSSNKSWYSNSTHFGMQSQSSVWSLFFNIKIV